ncbi:MAG: hypothetical protein ACFFAS_14330 [Promethearchaeota archaeon]
MNKARNMTREELVNFEAAMNQSRNMIYHLIRFMKENKVVDVRERLRGMGRNIAKTFYNYWNQIGNVNLTNLKDVLATMYKKILNSTIVIEVDEIGKKVKIKDTKCALCKYHYEDIGNFAGCEVLLGLTSEFIKLVNENSKDQINLYLIPIEVSESLSYGDKACIQVFNYKEGGK